MGPRFPAWLRWQTGIRNLDISNTRINDVLPHWFWVLVSNASSLDLSRNELSGGLPANLELPFIEEMDLSRNSFTGKLPANIITSPLKNLLLYNNNFTGPIPEYVCHILRNKPVKQSTNRGFSTMFRKHFFIANGRLKK